MYSGIFKCYLPWKFICAMHLNVLFNFIYEQLIHLGGYPGVRDSWMNVIASQGESLESVDISWSDITDCGLVLLKDRFNLQKLALNYCYQISDRGLGFMSSVHKTLVISSFLNLFAIFELYSYDCNEFGSSVTSTFCVESL